MTEQLLRILKVMIDKILKMGHHEHIFASVATNGHDKCYCHQNEKNAA